jgi:hypothetical protein
MAWQLIELSLDMLLFDMLLPDIDDDPVCANAEAETVRIIAAVNDASVANFIISPELLL